MKTIAEYRRELGWNQKDLADKAGLSSVTSVANWEQGRADPTARQLRTLSKLFNVPCEEITLPSEQPNSRWKKTEQVP